MFMPIALMKALLGFSVLPAIYTLAQYLCCNQLHKESYCDNDLHLQHLKQVIIFTITISVSKTIINTIILIIILSAIKTALANS